MDKTSFLDIHQKISNSITRACSTWSAGVTGATRTRRCCQAPCSHSNERTFHSSAHGLCAITAGSMYFSQKNHKVICEAVINQSKEVIRLRNMNSISTVVCQVKSAKHVRQSRFYFADLGGSEQLSKSKVNEATKAPVVASCWHCYQVG